MTVSASTADSIAGNLMINRPYIYSRIFSYSLKESLPKLYSWLNYNYESWVSSSVTPFQSLDGKEYLQFAKSGKWGMDLWDDLVAPQLQSPMNVETWRNGAGGRMSSICGSGPKAVKKEAYDIYMIAEVTVDGVSWQGTEDHSKWGSTTAQSGKTVSCVGDINRMCSQEERGGNQL